MVLSHVTFYLFFIAIFFHNANCQLDLDTDSSGADTSLTYFYINSNSAIQLFPSVSLSISGSTEDSTVVTVSTESGLSNQPCFTRSNTPPCEGVADMSGLNVNAAISFLESIYYENSDPIDGRIVTVTVTVRYQVNEEDRTFETFTQVANVLETRDKPVISFKDGYEYSPVYNHDLRPTPFLNGDNFTITSVGGLYTSFLVCVITQSELESISVDTNHPLVDSPLFINMVDRVCSRISFSEVNSATLLQVFPAFTYSETTDIIDNYNDRMISLSVDAGSNIGDPLYFNITYHITIEPTPIRIQAGPVVYYEDVATQLYVPNLSSIKMSDVISINRESLTDINPITSLLLESNSSHVPKVSLWNDQVCSTSWLTHPVHKFEFCTDEEFFFNLEITSAFQPRHNPSIETILVDGRELIIYNATERQMYAFAGFAGSATQNPDANHFSLWFKNAPGELTGCPLEITNGPQVDYMICLSGSDATILFWYSGLAPEHHEVRVTYPTEGAFRLDDWNYASVSVTTDSIHFLLNELELTPSEFYWFNASEFDFYHQIPVHLYRTGQSAFTFIYILGKDSGFIGEVTGVIVDQFFISIGEAYCMFSCIEGFYMNETVLNSLQERGLVIRFVRESFEVIGNISVSDVSYILQNLYYNTPANSSNTYRFLSATVSDDLFISTEVTRISFACTPNPCSDNSFCYATDTEALCLCEEGYLDASPNADMTLCKHPMDCSYLNGGCSELEACIQKEEEVRECVDACDSFPCLNDGTCSIISVSEYECTCTGEFYGIDCECRNSCLIQDCSPGNCMGYCNGSYICVAPSSSFIPTPTSSLLSTASQVVTSSFSSLPSQLTSPLLQTSELVPSSSLPSSSSTLPESTAPITSSAMTSSIVAIPGSSVSFSSSSLVVQSTPLIETSSRVATASSVMDTFTSSSSPLPSSSYIPFSSDIDLMTSSEDVVPTSSQVASSSVADFTSSSQIPTSSISSQGISSSSNLGIVSSVVPTSSQIPSSSITDVMSSSQIVQSSSVADIMTSSQVPSSSVVDIKTSSQIPSSSVVDIMTSSQVPSSSVADIMTSSQVPSSSVADIMTSSQVPSSSVISIMKSSRIPSSSVVAIISSQIPSSSITGVMTSSRAVQTSSVVGITTSSQTVSSSLIVGLTSSSAVEVMTSQIPSSSTIGVRTSSDIAQSSSVADILTSSQIPTIDTMTSSQVPSSSVAEIISSSQLVQSSSVLDIVTSSQIPSSSVGAMTSSQTLFTSSVVEPVTSTEVVLPASSTQFIQSSSSVDVPVSSEVVSSPEPIPTSSIAPVVSSVGVSTSIVSSSDVIEPSVQSSSAPTPPSSSIYTNPSSTDLEFSQSPQLTINVQSAPSSSSFSSISYTFVEPSIGILNTKSAEVSSTAISTLQPTTPPSISAAIDLDIAIGIGIGIFILIIVVILLIAFVIAFFLFRMSRHQDLDPTKEFDQPSSTSPAEITAVFKNRETTVIN